MVLSTGAGTGVVLSAVFNALIAPFQADEVWKSQGILGDVGLLVVSTHAAVRQGFLFDEESEWEESFNYVI